jgi:hypothetical protein
MMAEDYVRAFKHTTSYDLFKKGDRSGQGLNKSELLMQKKDHIYVYIHNVSDCFFY